MKIKVILISLSILALSLACNLIQTRSDNAIQDLPGNPPAGEQAGPPVPASPAGEEPVPTEETSDQSVEGQTPQPEPQSPASGPPPQSQAAEIRPPDRRPELTRLSALLGFQVLDQDGALLGTAADYIVNTCETYLIYFVLDPADGLGFASGSRLVIPFEVVTINSGALDAAAGAIQLHLASGQLAGAPAYPESLDLLPPDWEADVRSFWSQRVRLSNLTTECRVAAPEGGGTVVVHKIAYAGQLLGAALQDGLQNPLGTVVEAILEPESGKLSFFVIELDAGQGLVLVPLRAVNIPREALEPGSEIRLVLLTENQVLLDAPRLDSLEAAASGSAQSTARQYWER